MKNVVMKFLAICFCCLLTTSFAMAQTAPNNGAGSGTSQSQSASGAKAKKPKKHKKPGKKGKHNNAENSVCLSCIG